MVSNRISTRSHGGHFVGIWNACRIRVAQMIYSSKDGKEYETLKTSEKFPMTRKKSCAATFEMPTKKSCWNDN
uniref:Uncharacterized protein n=1 Tax=Romanomermis culicivorax TaxID=13658 RepID=A0A915LBN8_ROMCU